MRYSKNKNSYTIGVIIIISAILIFLCVKDGHEWGDDFALYISQAKALINLSIYKLYYLNRFSAQNSSNNLGPYLYPNGFPLLLSLVYYYFGNNFIIMKLFCGLFFLSSIPIMFRLFNRYFINSFYSFFIVLSIAFSWQYVSFADKVASDLPFFFFSFLSLMLMTKKNTILNQIMLGCSIYFSYFIRDVGIFLIPALIVYQTQQLFITKIASKRIEILIIPYIIFILLFLVVYILLPHGGENHFKMFFSDFSITGLYWKAVYYLYFISSNLFIRIRFFIPFLFMAFVGMYCTWRETLYMTVYISLIFVILLIWPADQGIRFIFPIIPFIIFFMIKGLLFFYNKFKLDKKSLVIALTVSTVVISLLNLRAIITYTKTDSNQCCTAELNEVYNYISAKIPEDKIVAFKKPRALRLFTNRNAISVPLPGYESSVANYLLINRSDYQSVYPNNKLIFQTRNYILISK